MDRGWMSKPRSTTAYKDGVEQFLSFAFRDVPLGDKILCPRVNCGNKATKKYDEVKTHLRCDVILQGYTKWVCHGEVYDSPSLAFAPMSNNNNNFHIPGFPMNSDVEGSNRRLHDIPGLLSAIFPTADRFESLSSSSDGELDGVQFEFENLEPGEPIGKAIAVGQMDDQHLVQAHRYVLRHCGELDDLRREFVDQENRKQCNLNLTEGDKEDLIRRHFADWLEQKVILDDGPDITEKIRALAAKPSKHGVRYSGYIINGFRFHTMSRETGRVTQNSGVLNIVENGVSYYGRLSDIFELSYRDYKVVFFKCDWYDAHHKAGIMRDEFGFTHVNFSRKIHKGQKLEDDPFVFSSQVEQVFYIQNPRSENWNTMVKFKPRDIFDMGGEQSSDETD